MIGVLDVDMLSIENLTVAYGSIMALRDVSLEVSRGEMVLLAGANGAGKSSLLKAVSGLVAPMEGEIRYDGKLISGWPSHRIAGLGIRHVPEGRRVWPGLSVAEHLRLAWHPFPKWRRRDLKDRIVSLFPRLRERWDQPAGLMSGGEQQMLAIARGLAGDPAFLLIDELSLGLAPSVVKLLLKALTEINAGGVTVLIVEQNLSQVLPFVQRGFVLETGRLVVEGSSEELLHIEKVQRAYLSI